jgi:hypothetical protein
MPEGSTLESSLCSRAVCVRTRGRTARETDEAREARRVRPCGGAPRVWKLWPATPAIRLPLASEGPCGLARGRTHLLEEVLVLHLGRDGDGCHLVRGGRARVWLGLRDEVPAGLCSEIANLHQAVRYP